MTKSGSTSNVVLEPGQIVNETWRVISRVGKGGFGAVYKVVSVKAADKKECAMKTESMAEEDESMIKMEVAILKTFRKQETHPEHVCRYFDSGQTTAFRYVVMELVGNNLGDLRRSQPEARFTESTTVRLGIQCLESIEALHRVGFIHRDVKPANYAMGKGDKSRIVYILDYGLARQLITREGQLREPRRAAGFRGTVRYASVNAHSRKELGRHDDLWSLLYVLVEFQRGELPWQGITEKPEVGKMKREIVADQLLRGMAPEFHHFMNELFGLHYGDVPNYAWFHQQLRAIVIRKKYRDTDRFDWEPPAKK